MIKYTRKIVLTCEREGCTTTPLKLSVTAARKSWIDSWDEMKEHAIKIGWSLDDPVRCPHCNGKTKWESRP